MTTTDAQIGLLTITLDQEVKRDRDFLDGLELGMGCYYDEDLETRRATVADMIENFDSISDETVDFVSTRKIACAWLVGFVMGWVTGLNNPDLVNDTSPLLWVGCLTQKHTPLLDHLSPTLFQRMKAAQMEAAQVWNSCCELHQEARQTRSKWPGQDELQQATKGRFALYSQSVQMVVRVFLANIETTRKLRATHPNMRMKYPWKTKRFYPVHWPAQAVSRERGRVVLPMGRGRASIVLPLDLPENKQRGRACHLRTWYP